MSARWRGVMPVRYLSDGRILPTEFRCWADARRHLTTSLSRHDRDAMRELEESVPDDGISAPLHIGVSDRDHMVYVCDGHHRAVVAMMLDIPVFPFQWYWIRSMGVRFEREPFPFSLVGEKGV